MYVIKVSVKRSLIEGNGFFAEDFIPRGTIVYFYSDKDFRYSEQEFEALDQRQKDEIIKYGVEDEFGTWIITEQGPYTNHSCDANVLPLFIDGIYTDIAVRDIQKGEEITCDYGMFYSSIEWKMECRCSYVNCRRVIGFGMDLGSQTESMLLLKISSAIKYIPFVKQPLFFLNDRKANEIKAKLESKQNIKLAKYIKPSLISSQ